MSDGGERKWLAWAREIQATAQTGLAFTANPYDKERYEALRALAVRIMADASGGDPAAILNLFAGETGYATPKVDVRAAIFRDNRILLVPELADGGLWTLPGGWADVNYTARENVEKEVREEAGYIVRATKLAAVYDRSRHPHVPRPFHAYKLFFICEITGETRKSDLETGASEFFPEDALPELSTDRVLPAQIHHMFAHWRQPHLPTDYD